MKSIVMKNSSLVLSLQFLSLTALMIVFSSVDAGATSSSIGGALCSASATLRGGAGRAIATIGVGAVGVGAMLGKVSWGLAILVGAGIGALFGSIDIVMILAGVAGC